MSEVRRERAARITDERAMSQQRLALIDERVERARAHRAGDVGER